MIRRKVVYHLHYQVMSIIIIIKNKKVSFYYKNFFAYNFLYMLEKNMYFYVRIYKKYFAY